MKRLLRFSTILALLLLFIPFFSYQTSRMRDPISIHFFEMLVGKSFQVSGEIYSSGFNVNAALSVLCILLGIAFPWVFAKNKVLRISVFAASAAAAVFLIRTIGDFGKEAPFTMMMDQMVKGGMGFESNAFFAAVLVTLFFNAIVCLTSERFAVNLMRFKWWYIMLLPALLYLALFSYLPMFGLSIMFVDFNPVDMLKSNFVGLKWFETLVNSIDGEFGRVLLNTLTISIYSMAVNFPAPIVLALLITECHHTVFKRVVQTVSYLPNFISWSIIGGLVITLLSSQYSLLNGIRQLLDPGDKGFYLLNENAMIRGTLVFSSLWKGIGWGSIIYIAGLTGVNPELYESAKLDGAGRLRQIWHISLPGISTLITLQLILSAPSLLNSSFDQVLNLVYPLTVNSGKTLAVYIYEIGVRGRGTFGLSGNYSYSTVIGFCNSIVAVCLLISANMIGKRINPDGAIW